MKGLLFSAIIGITSLLFSGCGEKKAGDAGSVLASILPSQTKSITVKDYRQKLEKKENKLSTDKTIDDINYSLTYRPWYTLAMLECSSVNPSSEEIQSKINEINDLHYFTFRLKNTDSNTEILKCGISSMDEYYARVEYFSFQMQEDLKLIDGTDTLDCVLFHYERTYGVNPEGVFSLGFPLSETENRKKNNHDFHYNDKTLVFNDRVFGSGEVFLTIKGSSINNDPLIKIQ